MRDLAQRQLGRCRWHVACDARRWAAEGALATPVARLQSELVLAVRLEAGDNVRGAVAANVDSVVPHALQPDGGQEECECNDVSGLPFKDGVGTA